MRDSATDLIPRPFTVVARREETHDVTTLMVEPADGRSCFEFAPAQIGMIGVPGVGEVPISFSNHPDSTRCLAVTIRAVGAITKAITSAGIGDSISIRGPYGTHWPVDRTRGRDVLFVAGGVGLAPLRSAIFAVAETDDRGSLGIVYGAQTRDDMLFRGDLEIWAELENVAVWLTVDRPGETWSGHVGLMTGLFDGALESLDRPLVMMCGPDAMIRNACAELVRRGVEATEIWVTMERNMKCGVGLCGHCQFGPLFLCREGPVLPYDRIADLIEIREV